MFVGSVHKVTKVHQAGPLVFLVLQVSTVLTQATHQFPALLECIPREEDLTTAQHAQLAVHVLILLVVLWLVLVQHMLKHCPQHARPVQLATAAQRKREQKYVHLMTYWDTSTALTQWYHVHSVPMQVQGKSVNRDTSYQSVVIQEKSPATMEQYVSDVAQVTFVVHRKREKWPVIWDSGHLVEPQHVEIVYQAMNALTVAHCHRLVPLDTTQISLSL